VWYWIATDLYVYYRGADYQLYMAATRRWLAGGPFYEPSQVAGPYAVAYGAILYPPIALLLFAPFTLLPPWAWWVVPLGLAGYGLWRMRPAPLVWPLLALASWWWTAAERIVSGNPDLWALAALSLGCAYDWPAVFVLLKPSLAPFALMGVWRRSWWIALAAFGLLCLPFGALWLDWMAVLRNAHAGILYSLPDVPLLLVPIVAWASRPQHISRRPEPPLESVTEPPRRALRGLSLLRMRGRNLQPEVGETSSGQ
jgi:hypothetical protein